MLIGSSIFNATLISREFKMCSSNILVLLKAYLVHAWFKCDEVVSYATEFILFLLSSLPCREARHKRTFTQMQQKLALSADQRWNLQHAARCTNCGNDEMRRSILSGLGGRLRADKIDRHFRRKV